MDIQNRETTSDSIDLIKAYASVLSEKGDTNSLCSRAGSPGYSGDYDRESDGAEPKCSASLEATHCLAQTMLDQMLVDVVGNQKHIRNRRLLSIAFMHNVV